MAQRNQTWTIWWVDSLDAKMGVSINVKYHQAAIWHIEYRIQNEVFVDLHVSPPVAII